MDKMVRVYDFNKVIDRKHTDCIKWDIPADSKVPQDVLSMWVADMDFETVPEVRQRLMEVATRGIYGYTARTEAYTDAVVQWFFSRFDWKIQPEWIVSTTGVVMALAAAVRALTEEGDAILIQQPVYYPFANVVRRNNRKLVINQLKECPGTTADAPITYEMDFVDLEEKIREHQVKMMILCNPHNPIGRVWKREELEQLCQICQRYQVQIVSDEIHCDFIRPGFSHVPFDTIDCPWSKRAVICTAPSKTFNLAGLQASNIVIREETIRKAYIAELDRAAVSGPGLFGLEACKTAYQYGAGWVDELNAYIDENYQYLKSFIETEMPKVKVIELQGTYLLWLDFRSYGYSEEVLSDKMLYEAKVWLDDGTMFGAGGAGFMRVNLATSRKHVERFAELIKKTFV